MIGRGPGPMARLRSRACPAPRPRRRQRRGRLGAVPCRTGAEDAQQVHGPRRASSDADSGATTRHCTTPRLQCPPRPPCPGHTDEINRSSKCDDQEHSIRAEVAEQLNGRGGPKVPASNASPSSGSNVVVCAGRANVQKAFGLPAEASQRRTCVATAGVLAPAKQRTSQVVRADAPQSARTA